MAVTETDYTIRACAAAVIRVIEQSGNDAAKLAAGLPAPLRRLMARPDLLSLGAPRVGNNVGESQYLYFDSDLFLILFGVPKGKPVPPHDHGIAESLFVYRGRLKHTVYERIDNRSVPGACELRIVEDRVLERGDFAVVAPPADIHGFTALADDTYAISVVNGTYKPDRHYYQPDEKTYLIRPQRNAR